jgi:protein-tyrosine kinase
MSRIHEALKRAEQERASTQGIQSEAPRPAEIQGVESVSANVEAAPAVSPERPPVPSMPSFASPYTFDALMARCGQVQWSPDAKTMLFFNDDEYATGTEEFRTLRSRLYQMREKMPLKKILVTSALPKEGKSFVAANLAQVMVKQHGRRALLIDADLRGSRLHSVLGTTSVPGLSEYLLGESDEFTIIQRSPMENLFFIPAGRNASSPAELVANGRLRTLLQRLEPLFDWIIVDSPPAVPISDASLLANFCDGVLIVLRSNATPFDAAKKARQEFQDKTLIGVVLNGVNVDSSYSRYYYTAYEKRETQPKA